MVAKCYHWLLIGVEGIYIMAKQIVNLSNDILEKGCKIKNGIVWAYLCSQDKLCTLEEIALQYKLPLKKTQLALEAMMEINAVFAEVVDGKLLYKANPETYFHTDVA